MSIRRPLPRARARDRGVAFPPTEDFTAHPGRGVAARVGDRFVQVGSPATLLGADATTEAVSATVARVRERSHLPLPLGVAGHEGSTVIVGLNGLRLLRAAAWRRAVAGNRLSTLDHTR